MYEDADEVDSICSTQNETKPILTKIEKRPPSFTEFPNEVEIRFATSPESGRQGINKRCIAPADTHLNERRSFSETENLSDSLHQRDSETNRTTTNTMKSQSLASCLKWRFFRQILCIDCC
jgi:hypothetical protein